MLPTRVRADEFFSGNPPVLEWPVLLAEGDSWFTLGELTGFAATNLMLQLDLPVRSTVVDAAYPGNTLQHMVDGMDDPRFDRLLRDPNFALSWSAILLSAGGNDLIDAAGVRPRRPDGTLVPLPQRLLLSPEEAAAQPPGVTGPARWVSEPGWAALAGFLRHNLGVLVQRRDSGPAHGRPLLLHTYSVPTVWAFGVPGNAREGWLFPALRDAGVPAAERQGVATLLFQRLRALWLAADADRGSHPLPHVHVFDSASLVRLTAPDPSQQQSSGDWANEIHPNRSGYVKLGRAMGPWVAGILARYR